MIQKIKKRDKAELWAGLSVALVFSFMLFIYAPTEIYCYNQSEFWFDLFHLLPIMLALFGGVFLILAIVVTLLFCFLPRVYRLVVLPFLSIAFVCTYVQGNFLISNLPPLDGWIPDWNNYKKEMLQSVILWIVVTVIIVALYRILRANKFAGAVKVVSVCMLLMFAVTMTTVLLTTEGYKQKMKACSTTNDLYVYSEDTNYIIFVLDTVDAQNLSELMTENPEYKNIFEDFTYYENMMGGYSCTAVALPHILSGEWFENETSILDYSVKSYNESPILDSLEKDGYKLGMYVFDMPYEDEKVYRFSNVVEKKNEISSYIDFTRLELKLIGIRYAPFQFKEKCLFNTNRFALLWRLSDDYPYVYLTENKVFYDRMQASEITTVDEKCFKMIHIDGGHVPFQYDENVNIIENATYQDNLKATMTITKAYLDKLKEAGVYDNSVIVIMADHGYAEEYGFEEGIEACEERQNPIFFAKGINESHDMQVSQAPVSYEDLQVAFARLLDGKSSEELFDYQEGDERERRYIYYDFMTDEHMYEYISSGHASDVDAMILTGEEYIRSE